MTGNFRMSKGRGGLVAPGTYWDLTNEQLSDISNGCGPKGWGWLVPDKFRIMGIDFSPACDIHDFCYTVGIPKKVSDNLFLENTTVLSKIAHFGFKHIAERLAFLYYLAVKNGGAGAYNRAKQRGRT